MDHLPPELIGMILSGDSSKSLAPQERPKKPEDEGE